MNSTKGHSILAKIPMFTQKILQCVFGRTVFTMRTGLAKGLRRRFGFGFRPTFNKTKEERFLASLDLRGSTVLDVGGYVGIHSLYFARAVGKGGKVFTFEPSPVSLNELYTNVRLNRLGNITIIPIALGKTPSSMTMVLDTFRPALSSLESTRQQELLMRRSARTITVRVESLDNLLNTGDVPAPDFIKIDVVGLELEVLLGMDQTIERHNPKLFIELHGVFLEELFALVMSKEYSVYHVESDRILDSTGFIGIGDGHIFCEHRERR